MEVKEIEENEVAISSCFAFADFGRVDNQCCDCAEIHTGKGIETVFGNTDAVRSGVSGVCREVGSSSECLKRADCLT